MRALSAMCMAFACLAFAAPAGAQLPVPIPPIGPPGGSPPPEQPPPPQNQPPAAQPPGSPPTGSVTDGVDPAHTGFVDDPNLVPPLRRRWTRTFANIVLGVRAAEGKLFTVEYRSGSATLLALDPLTGRNLWEHTIPSTGDLAYDSGRLFAPGADGVLRAYSPTDGSLIWESRLDPKDQQAVLYGPPVATGGTVYVNSHGTLKAVRSSDGAVLWSADGAGTSTVAAVDAERVYMAPGCDDVFAVARSDGHQLWNHVGCGSGTGGVPPSVFRGRVYVPDALKAFDAASGSDLGRYPGSFEVSPVFARELGLFLDAGRFTAINLATGKTAWKRPVGYEQPGDSGPEITLSPVAVGHAAYGVTSGRQVYALDLRNGVRIWHAKLPFLDGPGAANSYHGAMDVAPGLLLVPAGRKLTAFESVYRPAPGGVAAAATLSDVVYLERNFVEGVVGTDLRTKGRRVALEYDEPPYRGFKRISRSRIGPDGYFSFVLRTGVNARVRIRSGKAVSKVSTIYTYPRVRLKFHRPSPNRIRTRISARTPRSVRLGGRRMSLYVVRLRSRRAQLLGTGTLRRTGRGRSSAVVVFDALRHVGRRDYLATCVKGQLRLGLGRPTPFTRRCGRRLIHI